ncbi:RNA methyltransferase [Thiohalorhabdus methylotrophus]|uniref:tRNA (cytidine/uridine-2'-O-)-methyltransferase TrmJ n=1 Tax=Thiohalorhabdus methylotrophus TaxID=3242694 RepID=A0ABV4TW83_9GAMM
MCLDKVAIVLVEPSHPGNIGAAARAMKNMGLGDLRLVRPLRFPDAEATARASGADDVLAAATVHADLESALADAEWVAGTTARARELSIPVRGPRAALEEQLAQAAAGRRTVLVFGRERNGLTNEELDQCDRLVNIPTAEYSSLNLAQAVQILAYEALLAERAASGAEQDADALPAGGRVLSGLFEHLERVVRDVGFVNPQSPKRTDRRMRRLLLRAGPSETEVHFFRGFLSAIEKRIHGHRPRSGREEYKKIPTEENGRDS